MMRKHIGFLVFWLSAGTLVAAPFAYEVTSDRSNRVYRCGEKVSFTVCVRETNGVAATSGLIRAALDNFGPKVVAKANWNLAETNVFSIEGMLSEPGFLRLKVDPEPTARLKVWSVAVEPERIRKGSPSPVDFDSYWASERVRLAREVPLDAQMRRIVGKSTEQFDFYEISFATFGRRVYGFLSIPKDRAKAPYPVHIQVNAAGFGTWTNNIDGPEDWIRARFSVYPFAMDSDWKPLQPVYDRMNASSRERFGCGYPSSGISVSREDYFFHSVLLGIDRAVDWIAARPDVDLRRFVYEGTSQGGGFGFYLTGLNRHFTRAAFFVPALTDTMGYLAGRQSGWPQPVENNSRQQAQRASAESNAPYFDGANFASRIRCPVRVAVGFSDTTCAPCAVYGAYNEIRVGDKEIRHGFDMTHACFPEIYADLRGWLWEK